MKYEIAVVGAGAVGQEMLRILEERRFPARNIRVLARTPRFIRVDDHEYHVEKTEPQAFDGVDIALFAGTEGEKGASVVFAEDAIRRGAIVIDNGGDFRMRSDVPLVVPEVNAVALDDHHGLIANPNCSTAQLVVALKPIHDFAHVKRVIISTYQAVSGAGGLAVDELTAQTAAVAKGEPTISEQFPVQIVQNVIPQIGAFDDFGYSSEEMKLVHETRKILNEPDLAVTPVVAARVPVVTGHCESVYIETDRPVSVAEAQRLWSDAAGVTVMDDKTDPLRAYPMPLTAAGRDDTFVGRIRKDIFHPHGLLFWVVSDNLRKGAATNAVQIAEALVERNLVRPGDRKSHR